MAAKFFQFFTAQWSIRDVEVYLTRGYDLERWLLKMLCGLVMSGNATLDGQRLSNWTPPVEWIDILFGTTDVESPAGLHSIVGNYRVVGATLNVHPVFKSSTGQPIALAFVVSGIGFLFAMEDLPAMRQPSKTGADTRYRPMALQLRKGSQIREAHFGWPEGQLVTLSISID